MARTGHHKEATWSLTTPDVTRRIPSQETLMPAPKSTAKPVRTKPTRPTPGAADAPVPPVVPRPHNARAAWGVMIYLAGDTPWGSEALQDDLAEILKIG